MKLLWAHVKVDLLSLQRRPMSVFPGLILPGLLFLFMGIPHARDQTAANWIMTANTVFAVLGITFFQFGVAIAAARARRGSFTLRTLPLAPWVRFAARVLVALVVALAAVGLMVSLALLLTPAGLAFAGWLRWGLALLLGSVPLALLGIALGYWVSPTPRRPFANLLYIVLAYAGGLWTPPSSSAGSGGANLSLPAHATLCRGGLGAGAGPGMAGRGLALAPGVYGRFWLPGDLGVSAG